MPNKFHSSLLSIFLMFFAYQLTAQGIYRPGFMINQAQDTVHGLVYDGGDMVNSSECRFKTSDEGKARTYKPGEIQSYSINNYRLYKSMKLPLEEDSTLVFAEFLVNGIADIFYFRNITGNHYYIRNKEGEIIYLPEVELKKVRVNTNQGTENSNSKEKYRKDQRYIGILKYALKDQPEIFPRINNTRLEHKDLINLAENYHDLACTDGTECLVFSKKMPDRIKGFGATLETGYNFLTIVSADEKNNFYNLPYNEIKFGGSWYTNLPQLNRHLFLNTRVLFVYTYNTEIPDETYEYESYSREIILDYEYAWLEFQANLNYMFRTEKKVRPFISFGGLLDLGLKFENHKTEVLHFYNTGKTKTIERIPPHLNSSYIGMNAGAGVAIEWKNGDVSYININYTYKTDQTYVNSFATIKGLNLGISYYF